MNQIKQTTCILMSVFCVLITSCEKQYGAITDSRHAESIAANYVEEHVGLGSRKISDYNISANYIERYMLTRCETMGKFDEDDMKECFPSVYEVRLLYKKDEERLGDVVRDFWSTDDPVGCLSAITVYLEKNTGKIVEEDREVAYRPGKETLCD